MSSRSGFDGYYSQPRGFLTPPPPRGTRRCSPALPASEKRPAGSSPPARSDLFHVIHKVPSGDSPYVRAKHVQLIDKDPSKAISLFWAAINSGDRVDSALKDMAVVMKQLDRSDEAIEAIKSFHHLCPPESQESIDNILVELYKQSGRVEEEIEMLRLKLKQVEQGMAFGGKRIKTARSQGKKVQITVEKEYSRLLGNLAWAYMQNKDYKFAEEHYRKALSFESDKNKQCNLAICLMHSNKLTEARFLLQAIRGSSSENSPMDESYAKSYERASQILVEFESSSSPLPVPVDKTNKTAAFTEFPYEKRADFDWRRNSKCQQLNMNQEAKNKAYESPAFPNRGIPRIPFTQPRTYVRLRDQESKGGLTEETLCRQLLFGSVEARENVGNNNKMLKAMQFPQEQFSTTTTTKNAKEEKREVKMSWADMVEEDEQRFGKWRNKNGVQRQYHPDEFAFGSPVQERAFNDENLDSNIILPETPNNAALHQAEKLSQEIGLMNIGSSAGYLTQPGKTTNQTVRRSLCFDQNQNNGGASSPSTMKALIFEGQQGGGGLALSEGSSDSAKSSLKRRNRLQVFQDITTQIV